MLQAPIHAIENIVCFGFKALSPPLMAFCAENSVGICYLSCEGRFLARVAGSQQGNVLLRKAQYGVADRDADTLAIARPIVGAKVSNTRHILLRHMRNHPESSPEAVTRACNLLGHKLREIEHAANLDELRGYEGDCAAEYFSVMPSLIGSGDEAFAFRGRSRRPPLDAPNAILSFLYAILANDVRSALETTGLDPQVGFLHRIRVGRPSLALDLMEELRAYLADRIMLNLINLRQVVGTDFERRESGEVRMTESARRTLLAAYQRRKQEEIVHPYLQEKITVGLIPHVQAQLMARHIRGDLPAYPPFLLR